MESFAWSDSFETGIELVDQQHRGLVDIVNRFGDGVTENTLSADDLKKLIAQMRQYAEQHFHDEEQLMRSKGIDDRHFQQHTRIHAEFHEQVEAMAHNVLFKSSHSALYLLDFLVHWLAYHILGMDQNMARQLAYIDQGINAAEAYELEERERDASTEPLLKALDGLFDKVSHQNRELQQFNQELEKKVEERTKELLRANAALEALSLTDALTELPNRRQAMNMLDVFWQESKEHNSDLACIMIDADHFKEVNDNYGHDRGDEVLRSLARTLSHAFRTDDLVCRLGGDEFFVICPNTNLDGAMQIAETTRQTVAEMRVETGGNPWIGSISVGVAARQAEMSEPAELVKKSDESVYLAKKAGKNCVRKVQ